MAATHHLSDIPVFVEAVEARGFSAAAQRLHLSRSAVGKTVARLEARLGVRLFHRTTRTLRLTEEGEAYYASCKRALAEIRAGEAVIDSGRQEVAGRLRVTMPVLFGRHCVVPVLSALAEEHPRLELDLSLSDRNADLFEDGFDLAVRSGRLLGGDELVARRIAEQRMHVCASPEYLARHGVPESVGELEDHQLLAYARSGRTPAWLFPAHAASCEGKPIEVVPKARLRFDDLQVLADVAAAGMGLAWLPCWLIRERVEAGELVRVLADEPAHGFDIHAVWPRAPHLPYRTRVAIDRMAQALPSLMDV